MATFVVVACVFVFLWGGLEVVLGLLEMVVGLALIVGSLFVGGRR